MRSLLFLVLFCVGTVAHASGGFRFGLNIGVPLIQPPVVYVQPHHVYGGPVPYGYYDGPPPRRWVHQPPPVYYVPPQRVIIRRHWDNRPGYDPYYNGYGQGYRHPRW